MGLLRTSLVKHAGVKKMAPRKPLFVASVPVTSHIDGDKETIGTAKVEQLPHNNFVYHIDASGMTAEQLRRGLSFGDFTPEEERTEA